MPVQGNYFKTQHLHDTQQIIVHNMHILTVTLQVIPDYELLQTLLTFEPEVEVMEPERLKHELKGMLEKSLGIV